MSSCNYTFKTNKISRFSCQPRAPQAKFKLWVWPFYRGRVTFFKDPLKNQRVVRKRVNKRTKKITRNMSMATSNYAFKTNEISTIWCRLRAPEGPPGSPRGAPRPPPAIQRHCESRGKWPFFKKRVKRRKGNHQKHDHVNVRLCL